MTEDRSVQPRAGSARIRDAGDRYDPVPVVTSAGAQGSPGEPDPGGPVETEPPREAGERRAVPRPLRYDPRPAVSRPAIRRRTRLALTRVDPWSVFVLSLLVTLFLGVALLIAVVVLYALLDAMGVLTSIDTFASDLQLIDPGQSLLGAGRVLGLAAIVAAIDVVLLTALATLAAFLYNLCASLTGGVEVVLAERE